MAEINEALLIKREGGGDDYAGYAGGWNGGVRDVTSGNHEGAEATNWEFYDDAPHFVSGYYHNLWDDDYYGHGVERVYYEGWNEGKEAALAMKEGMGNPIKEKSSEEILYERRMKCFTMAEKYAPVGAVRGQGEREPVGETIARAEALYNYFHNGTTPGATPVKEGK